MHAGYAPSITEIFVETSCSAQHKALRRYLDEGGRREDGEGVMVRSEDVRGALREVRPSAMREVTLEVPKVCECERVCVCVCEMVCVCRCCGRT